MIGYSYNNHVPLWVLWSNEADKVCIIASKFFFYVSYPLFVGEIIFHLVTRTAHANSTRLSKQFNKELGISAVKCDTWLWRCTPMSGTGCFWRKKQQRRLQSHQWQHGYSTLMHFQHYEKLCLHPFRDQISMPYTTTDHLIPSACTKRYFFQLVTCAVCATSEPVMSHLNLKVIQCLYEIYLPLLVTIESVWLLP